MYLNNDRHSSLEHLFHRAAVFRPKMAVVLCEADLHVHVVVAHNQEAVGSPNLVEDVMIASNKNCNLIFDPLTTWIFDTDFTKGSVLLP